MSARPAAAVAWPPVGGLVRVVGQPQQLFLAPPGLPSRVEDSTGDRIALAAPRGPTGARAPGPGEELEMAWANPRGLQVYPLRLVGRADDGPPLWWCELTGPVELRQRRAFARAQVLGGWPVRVALRWDAGDGAVAEGSLVDISEGGIRARVADWPGGDAVPVVITLTLADGALDGMAGAAPGTALAEHQLAGTVLRGTATGAGGPGSTTEVGIALGSPAPTEQLRALVFAWQLAARRAAAL